VCYGPPGVGKTQSARPYANSDELEPALRTFKFYDSDVAELDLDARTIVYTPKVHNTPRIVDKEVRYLQDRLGWLIEIELAAESGLNLADTATSGDRLVELLVVDEADRLQTPSLEQLRDHHDRTGVGLILIACRDRAASRALTPAVLADRVCARVRRAQQRRADARPRAPLGRDRAHALRRRLHRRRSNRRRRADHQRQLPPRPTPLRTDHSHPGDQQRHTISRESSKPPVKH
jgi:DNA transposition AAA+ family ATPase